MSGEELLGTTYPVFIGVTLIFMCGCAVLMGRELARAWRPAQQIVPYVLLLGVADRLVIFSMFGGVWRSPSGFAIDTGLILLAAAIAHRLTLAAQMVRQYPWLYRRFLLFGWRKR